jgi:hypothetical protein
LGLNKKLIYLVLTTQNCYPLPSLSCICPTRTPYYGCVCGKQRDNSPHLCLFCYCTSKWCIPMLRCIPCSDGTCRTIISVSPYFFPSQGIWPSSTSHMFHEANSGAHARAAFSSLLSTPSCARLPLYFSEVTTPPPISCQNKLSYQSNACLLYPCLADELDASPPYTAQAFPSGTSCAQALSPLSQMTTQHRLVHSVFHCLC